MKAYRIELLVLDFESLGDSGIKSVIENGRYPNHCINPSVQVIQSADIGEWHDDHPLNSHLKCHDEYMRLFATPTEKAEAALQALADQAQELGMDGASVPGDARDPARLMFAMQDIDGFVGVKLDKYDYATWAATVAGNDEPTPQDELTGVRALIDAAMQKEGRE